MKHPPQKSPKAVDLKRRYLRLPDPSGPVPRPAPGPRNVDAEDVRRAVKDLFRERARHAAGTRGKYSKTFFPLAVRAGS